MLSQLTDLLSSQLNNVPPPGKLAIIPLRKTSPGLESAGSTYVVQFNPEQLTEQVNFNYDDIQADGSISSIQRFSKKLPPSFQLEFLIDGTGADGQEKKEVEDELEHFKNTLEFNGELHAPPKVLLIYGSFKAICTLYSYDIKYTMFRKNGTPLRAKVKCNFKEHKNKDKENAQKNLHSPDLTRKHKVLEGQTLPGLCKAYYDNPLYCIQVARFNRLSSIRNNIEPGKELTFSPIKD